MQLLRQQLKQLTSEQGSGSPCTHLYAHRLLINPVLISIVLCHVALCLGADHSNAMPSVGVSDLLKLLRARTAGLIQGCGPQQMPCQGHL